MIFAFSSSIVIPADNPVYFFTATVLYWKHLLKPDKYKKIILSSMEFMTQKKRMLISGFVIMPNHIHMICSVCEGHKLKDIQRDMLKFTSQQIKFDLVENHPEVLKEFISTQNDRKFQIWERRPLAVPLYTYEVIEQKLEYIHRNPIHKKWNLAENEEDYYYSSASYYLSGKDR
ncbi:MAG: transposase, partial [Chitinophagaceae bacterium]